MMILYGYNNTIRARARERGKRESA
eukprot:COSAG03_NODE_25444_length_265_cov_1.096386_1_plen_24_part_10